MDVTPGGTGDAGHSAASIRLDGIRKRYPDGTEAVRELSLEVTAGELVVLIGPSGCGKSTVLRMVNRLIEPTGGRILLGDEDITRVDPVKLRRRIGYVIQNVGLFPHQTVTTNVGTVPRLLGWPKERIRRRSGELLELVGLDPAQFGRRYPHELSGGQRQRVGVARALAADPVVLLMDEPFSAVDPIVRTRLQEEFLRLQAEVRKTIVLVTHDLDEAVRLGDRIAVLSEGGRLEQYDTPAALLGTPASPFVREFVGADRGIRRLAVTPVTREVLDGEADATVTDATLPELPLGRSAYDALAAMLTAGTDAVVVTADGRPAGTLSRARVLDLGQPGS
ncbi:ABC transporter ATP-binding protein [Micromonospora rifamycinica]|uniref:ABC-type quaternary amine transporter n=1 Tax=Micromonospora rifamycinica TaxID=291594 RepID=A0A120FA08_9ACTN|nr:ATP-binding cassette domain-containing protein [Micromonospora rifamycinica]KWV34112.1 glycine/betaine ABC transporter [Micromonospora rifamycinica]SCG76762.1 osmoprotectant transport system ATP-binding protein [Micromonospora rifamycinica]